VIRYVWHLKFNEVPGLKCTPFLVTACKFVQQLRLLCRAGLG